MNQNSTSSLKDNGELRPGLLRLLLGGKGDDGPRGVCLLFVIGVAVPSFPPILLLPLLFLPSDPDPSCHLLE